MKPEDVWGFTSQREQYYLDLLNPSYNSRLIAGSSKGVKRTEETKTKISKALKGIYVGAKSRLFGSVHSEDTKNLMSKSKIGDKNPNYGKIQPASTQALMSKAKSGKTLSSTTKFLLKMVNLFIYTGWALPQPRKTLLKL